MPTVTPGIVVGLDVGGNSINATVLDGFGVFLVEALHETPSRVLEGPAVAVEALAAALDGVLAHTGLRHAAVRGVGLDTPGPASADGVISARGATNFAAREWWGFDFRSAVEERLGLPVIYNNDGNAAALYAHERYFGDDAPRRPSYRYGPGRSSPGCGCPAGSRRGRTGCRSPCSGWPVPGRGPPRPAGTPPASR